MEQLILDIHAESDALLIKEVLKKFKTVEVLNFSSDISVKEIKKRIAQGIKDADEGRVTPWETVKANMTKKIRDYKK